MADPNTKREFSIPHNEIDTLTASVASASLQEKARNVNAKESLPSMCERRSHNPSVATAKPPQSRKKDKGHARPPPRSKPPKALEYSKSLLEQMEAAAAQAAAQASAWEITATGTWEVAATNRRQLEYHSNGHTLSKSSPSSPVIPCPTPEYMARARREPVARTTPQPLLVILDLNGTILRKHKRKGSKPCTATLRPHAGPFLKWLFEESNHTVMIWSSITPQNVRDLVNTYIPASYAKKLTGIWARDTLRLSAAGYRDDSPTYKRLEWVWESNAIQKSFPTRAATEASVPDSDRRWGQHNTLLIDDSCLKAVTQPFNHIQIPEFVQKSEWRFSEDDHNVLGQVRSFLDLAAMWTDISQHVRRVKFQLNQAKVSVKA